MTVVTLATVVLVETVVTVGARNFIQEEKNKIVMRQKKKKKKKKKKKIDGLGPVDNRPSTDELHHFVLIEFLFRVNKYIADNSLLVMSTSN